MARNQVWDKGGNLIEDVAVADPVPQIPANFEQMTITEFLSALVSEQILSQTKMNNILNRLKR